jgi:small subunit ribosomal protein S1
MSGAKNDESFASMFERSGATPMGRRFRPGERIEVEVVVIGRDAVFAELGGKQEGYFDLPDLTGSDGKLTVSVGSRISATVASVDDATGQVRLTPVFVRASSAIAEFDATGLDVVIPKSSSSPLLVEGAHVKGKVTGIERYGLFVQIQGTQGRGGRGLIPVSETATARGSDLKKHFTIGQDVEAKILSIGEDGKIRLSMKAVAEDTERQEFDAYAKGGGGEKTQKAKVAAEPRNFGTLGDLLKKKR